MKIKLRRLFSNENLTIITNEIWQMWFMDFFGGFRRILVVLEIIFKKFKNKALLQHFPVTFCTSTVRTKSI